MLPAALDAKDVCGLLLTFKAHCVLSMVENSEPPFFIAPDFSGGQYFQLPWMPKMFRMSCCCWHSESIVVCWQNCLCQVSLIPIASFLSGWQHCRLPRMFVSEWFIVDFWQHYLWQVWHLKFPFSLPPFSEVGNNTSCFEYLWSVSCSLKSNLWWENNHFFSECQDFVEPHIPIRCVANIFYSFKRMREMS